MTKRFIAILMAALFVLPSFTTVSYAKDCDPQYPWLCERNKERYETQRDSDHYDRDHYSFKQRSEHDQLLQDAERALERLKRRQEAARLAEERAEAALRQLQYERELLRWQTHPRGPGGWFIILPGQYCPETKNISHGTCNVLPEYSSPPRY